MIRTILISRPPARVVLLQAGFLRLLPQIENHARIYFRHIRCRHRRADFVAEAVALSWMWYVRLAQRGKDAADFVAALCRFAARAVRSGGRVCGQERARDVLSPVAQQRRGFAVGKLPDFSTLDSSPLQEALIDNRQTPVPEQVCFRLDFPAWLRTLGRRNRQILDDLMLGERTGAVARKYGLSAARVSQLRREFQCRWVLFVEGLGAATAE
jgi:hypothetical protein